MAQQGEPVKMTYRLYWTNSAGRIASVAQIIDADDDLDAVRKAKDLAQARTGEVWQGARHVVTLNGETRTER